MKIYISFSENFILDEWWK